MSEIKLLGLSGSLRKGSYNLELLNNIRTLLPLGVTFEIYESVGSLPLYSQDLDGDNLDPEAKKLRDAISNADGVVIASPEHNFSLSAALKNTLDWASRPYAAHPFVGKPTAILGASGGILGTIRAQLHTREILHSLEADVVSRPEVLITEAGKKFDQSGKLTDEFSIQLLAQLLDNLLSKIEIKLQIPQNNQLAS